MPRNPPTSAVERERRLAEQSLPLPAHPNIAAWRTACAVGAPRLRNYCPASAPPQGHRISSQGPRSPDRQDHRLGAIAALHHANRWRNGSCEAGRRRPAARHRFGRLAEGAPRLGEHARPRLLFEKTIEAEFRRQARTLRGRAIAKKLTAQHRIHIAALFRAAFTGAIWKAIQTASDAARPPRVPTTVLIRRGCRSHRSL